MSTTMLRQHVDGLEALKDLIALAKNPKDIEAAAEVARKQLALTEEEAAKADAARTVIANAEKTKQEFKAKEDALKTATDVYEKAVKDFNRNKEDHLQVIESKQNELFAKHKEHSAAAAQLAEERKQIDTRNAVADQAMRRREEAVQKREEAAKTKEAALANEEARLILMKDALTKKAKIINEALSA